MVSVERDALDLRARSEAQLTGLIKHLYLSVLIVSVERSMLREAIWRVNTYYMCRCFLANGHICGVAHRCLVTISKLHISLVLASLMRCEGKGIVGFGSCCYAVWLSLCNGLVAEVERCGIS